MEGQNDIDLNMLTMTHKLSVHTSKSSSFSEFIAHFVRKQTFTLVLLTMSPNLRESLGLRIVPELCEKLYPCDCIAKYRI